MRIVCQKTDDVRLQENNRCVNQVHMICKFFYPFFESCSHDTPFIQAS